MLAAVVVPFLVHLLPWPWPKPAGVYLLPVFWTAFVAVYFNNLGSGLLVALSMPAVNLVVTGLPALDWLGPMSLELVGYVLAATWMVKRWPGTWLAAPLAYVPAKALVIAIQWVIPAMHDPRNPFFHLRDSLLNGLAGLGVLLVINLALVKIAPRDLDWDDD
jgi:hypothetical protein